MLQSLIIHKTQFNPFSKLVLTICCKRETITFTIHKRTQKLNNFKPHHSQRLYNAKFIKECWETSRACGQSSMAVHRNVTWRRSDCLIIISMYSVATMCWYYSVLPGCNETNDEMISEKQEMKWVKKNELTNQKFELIQLLCLRKANLTKQHLKKGGLASV
jgi:hypothetical protein